ncbi:MAG TPA: adenosylcobinamide-GDP ribazoletransferase [Coriobacteriia bacterium]|nr:adenosylcobinamide-GDP ribazoletransferase [Coriobacteriia bacterium]
MGRSRPLRDLGLAITLLTALPIPVRWPDARERPDVASWFPVVGLGFGVLLLGVYLIAVRFFYGISGVTVALILALLAVATRLLHWDALADTADAWFVAPGRRLDVMADSHVGAFGATAIALVVLLQWSSLVELGGSRVTAATVVLVPVFGRLAASFSAWLGQPARQGGLGASVIRRPTVLGALASAAAVGAAIALAAVSGASTVALGVIALAGLALALVVPHLIALRFGGVTGDTMGASVVVVETGVLLVALVTVAVLRLVGVSA